MSIDLGYFFQHTLKFSNSIQPFEVGRVLTKHMFGDEWTNEVGKMGEHQSAWSRRVFSDFWYRAGGHDRVTSLFLVVWDPVRLSRNTTWMKIKTENVNMFRGYSSNYAYFDFPRIPNRSQTLTPFRHVVRIRNPGNSSSPITFNHFLLSFSSFAEF